jgi:tRNA-binding EMAP/Myf-like protein
MSTHEIAIVEIDHIEKHPNPEVEKMEITHIWGWQCCIGKDQFKVGDRAIYVPPDYLCPLSRPEFAFLRNEKNAGETMVRIKVRKFKGALSQGLIISVPEELKDLPVGSNVIEQLGIERYEPPLEKSTYGMFVGAPSGLYCPTFDVESYQRYRELFKDGEEVIATEKLHGCLHASTPVMLANGEYRPISELQVGDTILSYDHGTETFVPDQVDDVLSQRLEKSWVRLTFEDGRSIDCTEDHKFLTQRGWVQAKDLLESDDVKFYGGIDETTRD